jgi:hypothetical protein
MLSPIQLWCVSSPIVEAQPIRARGLHATAAFERAETLLVRVHQLDAPLLAEVLIARYRLHGNIVNSNAPRAQRKWISAIDRRKRTEVRKR